VLQNLFVLGWEKVGLVKRMVCGLFSVLVGAAADGRGTLMGVAVGGAVEAWRYDMVRTVSLMGCNLILKD
jgi:hypothetical protein